MQEHDRSAWRGVGIIAGAAVALYVVINVVGTIGSMSGGTIGLALWWGAVAFIVYVATRPDTRTLTYRERTHSPDPAIGRQRDATFIALLLVVSLLLTYWTLS